MAPNFLSKFVNKSSGQQSSPRPSTDLPRPPSRNPSPVRASQTTTTTTLPDRSLHPSTLSLASSNATGSSIGLDVQVVPPSPSEPDSQFSSPISGLPPRPRAVSLVVSPPTPGLPVDDTTPVPTPVPRPAPARRSSTASLNDMAPSAPAPRSHSPTPARAATDAPTRRGRPPTVAVPDDFAPPPTSVFGAMAPIVESPTTADSRRAGFFPPVSASTLSAASVGSSLLSAPDNSDAASVYSVSTGKKKRMWTRSRSREPMAAAPVGATSPPGSPRDKRRRERKPTALTAALAGVGMSLAAPSSPPISPPRRSNSISSLQQAQAADRHSVALAHQPRGSLDLPPSRRGSVSEGSRSSVESSDGNESSEDEDVLDGLDLDDDIPVTGFAVASSKRNADFHELFPSIPEGDYLIEDYGCALARDILVQGRLYISENHLCFHANIFGWITDLSVPIHEVTGLEKKMTALIIPNAIQVSTRDNKHTFASFMARDTAFDVVYNVWRLARPRSALQGPGSTLSIGGASIATGADASEGRRPGMDGARASGGANSGGGGGGGAVKEVATGAAHQPTTCSCGQKGEHYTATAMEGVFPGTPEKIYNLMYASGFMKDFLRNEERLMDIQASDWSPAPDTKLLSRNMSYIKPLNGSIGPKQTKCELKDETVHYDPESYISTVTTTRTPEVPSGTVFAVKTRACLTWANALSTRVVVTTQVDWTGRSFIKGIIERSAIDGQMTYHADLDKAMRAYIHAHRAEFIPEGVDTDAIERKDDAEPRTAGAPAAAAAGPATPGTPGTPDADDAAVRAREKERKQRGLQWAYDTFDGALKVARQSAEGALDLLSDAWDGSSSATALWFVIAALVVSNVWTLAMMGRREEAGRRKALKAAEERERWVQGIVKGLWEERAAAGQGGIAPPPLAPPTAVTGPAVGGWKGEVEEMEEA